MNFQPRHFLARSSVFFPACLTGYLLLKARYPWLPGWSCPIRHLTGIPCPGCFLTRSVGLSLTGQLGEALELHVLGPPVALGLMAWAIQSFGQKRLVLNRWHLKYLLIVGHLALIVWSIRIVGYYVFGLPTFPLLLMNVSMQ